MKLNKWHIIIIIVVLIMYNQPKKESGEPFMARVSAFTGGDDNLESFSSDMNIWIHNTEYFNYFMENPLVKGATIYNLSNTEYFWEYVEDLETAGEIYMPKPVSLQLDNTSLILTAEEDSRIMAAKAAHGVYIDINDLVAWDLSNYTKGELGLIFMFDYGANILDHSPSEAYDYAKYLVEDSQRDTLLAIFDDLRQDYIHGWQPYEIDTLKESLTSYDINNKRVSKIGCHSMSDIVKGLLKSLNIPAYREVGWVNGLGHSSLFIPAAALILHHGDDVYYTDSGYPAEGGFMFYNWFESELQPCGQRNTDCAPPKRLRYSIIRQYLYNEDYYCGKNRDYETSATLTSYDADFIVNYQTENCAVMYEEQTPIPPSPGGFCWDDSIQDWEPCEWCFNQEIWEWELCDET